MHQPPFIPPKDAQYQYLIEFDSTQGHSSAGKIRLAEKSKEIFTNQNHNNNCKWLYRN
jgi:hypothetical protein